MSRLLHRGRAVAAVQGAYEWDAEDILSMLRAWAR